MKLAIASLTAALLASCQSGPRIAAPEPQPAPTPAAQPSAGKDPQTPAAADPDPIGRVEAYIRGNFLWTNGLFPEIRLPASARPEEVLAAFLQKASFDKGKVTSPRIVATREIGGSSPGTKRYTAVYFESEQGDWVVLMRHEGDEVGWWTKALDPEQLGPPPQ